MTITTTQKKSNHHIHGEAYVYHHEDHEHSHGGCIKHNEALVPKWQAKLITAGQLGAAALQTVALIKGAFNPAAAIDLAHNLTDGLSWGGHARLVSGNGGRNKERLRTYTYGAISAGGALSVVDGVRSLAITGHEYATNAMNFAASSVSVGVAGLTAALAYRGIRKKGYRNLREVFSAKHDEDARGIAIHAGSDAVTAGSAFASSLPHMSNTVGGVAAVVAGSVCAAYFYPKKEQVRELARQYSYEGRHRKERQPGRLRRAAAMGTAVLAMTGVMIASPGSGIESVDHHISPPVAASPFIIPESNQAVESQDVHIAVDRGDSQWSITESYLRDTMGMQPTERQILEASNVVARYNIDSIPNPAMILPGSYVSIPSIDVLATSNG